MSRELIDVGLVLGSALAPEQIGPAARNAEQRGFDEVWLAEDMFFTGGISGAQLALASTDRITVGIGVMSAMVRHPALLAVEVATTLRSHPDRLIPGIGLGVPAWMRQMGLHPASPLRAVRECVEVVRALLAGETVTSGPDAVFQCDEISLEYPVDRPVPIHIGVVGPKMLAMSGRVADGTILSVGAGIEYLDVARRHVDDGRAAAGRTDGHRITQFAITAVDDDGAAARAAAARTLAMYTFAGGRNAITEAAGISDEVESIAAEGGSVDEMAARMPSDWVERLTISGTPDEVAGRIADLAEGGADAVALFPIAVRSVDATIAQLGDAVLPRLD